MQKENYSTKSEMTFSAKVKEELSRRWNDAKHCQIAEVAAIVSMCGKVTINSYDNYSIRVHTENISVARKYFTLIRKAFNINVDTFVTRNKTRENVSYTVIIKKHEDALRVLRAIRLMNEGSDISEEYSIVNNPLIRNSCCKRAFVRGAFLTAGSISNPEKSYHAEIVCASAKKAEQLQKIMNSFEMDAKIVVRKQSHVVYLKDGTQIVEFLNVMEAFVALMELENVRIIKEMRNTVNRKVNCETANIHKTVSAAVKQAEDIYYIKETIGLHKLPEGLVEIAELRLKHPEATLKELGDLLTEPVGKSGVNHRIRKLSEIAENLRENKEETL